MDGLKPFDDRLAALIANLSPAGRRKMAGEIAKKLRTRQQQRIKAQKDPDGKPYAARKRQPVKSKKGRIKREMFAKLRTNRYMKATGSDEAAAVEFVGRVQRIARVHQYGLKDISGQNKISVKYPERRLLGFTHDDEWIVEVEIIERLFK
jgi:phage virion morphogenesis protein